MPAALSLRNAKRLTLIALIFFLSLFTYHFSLSTVYAGSGLLTQIGGATFIQGASQFWVTSSKPTFTGITTANTSVTGTVGDQTLSATADTSGNWSWIPATDLSGDNPVTITSGSTTVSLTLTIGDVPSGVASSSAGTLAPAGTISPTFIILGFGIALTFLGLFGFNRTRSAS